MNKRIVFGALLCLTMMVPLRAETLSEAKVDNQPQDVESIIPSLPGERWWGGCVGAADQMPFDSNTGQYNLATYNFNNQNSPLLLSSEGRYVWSDEPYSFQFKNDTLLIHSEYERVEAVRAGECLRDALLAASREHFAPTGTIPKELFFSQPQYNTWIELMYDQNQQDILNYAHKALDNGFPAGIFMVDDNWQRYYGNFDFKAERFEDPKAMTDELHSLGFKIMLWICPFISADSPEYREMRDRGYLLRDGGGYNPAIVYWWNGYSACLDVTNPEAVEYFKSKLRRVQEEYGVDGFKFDAGDVMYMTGDYTYYDPQACASTYSQKWAELALEFPYNELRTTWKTGGQPLVQRLGDKPYTWQACASLIPGMTTAGLLGYPYACPDMIGGGEYTGFLNIGEEGIDEELIVRSCQVHALMPMMQFSVAPWRVLSRSNMEICARYARLHESMGEYILQYAHIASETGEPIVRSMEYQYPHQGFLECRDQFMLGDKYLVAPMTGSGTHRSVTLPKGRWRDDRGQTFRGPRTIEVEVPLERLPYYELVK